jgi:hypothetical protein
LGFEQNPLASFKTNYRTSGGAKIGQKVVGDWNCLKLRRIEEGWVGQLWVQSLKCKPKKKVSFDPNSKMQAGFLFFYFFIFFINFYF